MSMGKLSMGRLSMGTLVQDGMRVRASAQPRGRRLRRRQPRRGALQVTMLLLLLPLRRVVRDRASEVALQVDAHGKVSRRSPHAVAPLPVALALPELPLPEARLLVLSEAQLLALPEARLLVLVEARLLALPEAGLPAPLARSRARSRSLRALRTSTPATGYCTLHP